MQRVAIGLQQGLVGVFAALAVPLYLRSGRLERLLEPVRMASPAGAYPELAVRAARLTLVCLARLRTPLYRSTCLYRSVAECLLLRWQGQAAVVRIGVQDDPAAKGCILAHAWVEHSLQASVADAVRYEVLGSVSAGTPPR